MAENSALGIRDEFVNTTEGWVGAVQIGPHGEQKGIAIGPHGNVWLTEDEQILTANAPRDDADNPFIDRIIPPENPGEPQTTIGPVLELRTKGMEIKSRRPFGGNKPEVAEEETGAAPLPEGEPAEGTRPAEEEVATPDAVPEGKRRRKAATGV